MVFELAGAVSIYNAKRAQLVDTETHNQLHALEMKMKQIEGVNFEMKDCKLHASSLLDIASKSSESDYRSLSLGVVQMTGEINSQLIKISQQMAAR